MKRIHDTEISECLVKVVKVWYTVDSNEIWKGSLGEFDKMFWFSRDIIMWSYTDALKSVIILVDWRQ